MKELRSYIKNLLMEVPLDDFEYVKKDNEEDVMVREEVADYFKAIPQSVNIYIAHTDDLSWAHRLPNEVQGKVSGFKSRGQVGLTDIANVGKIYPQIQKAMNPEGINLLYIYPKSYEVPAGGDSFIADVNPHYLAHDLHHMLENSRSLGSVKDPFTLLIKEYLMELVWLSHGGGSTEAEQVRDTMKKTGRRLGVADPHHLMSELFPGIKLPSGDFDLFGDIFADYLKNDGNLVLGVPEQLSMNNGDIIELNPDSKHDQRAVQYEKKFKDMLDTLLDPLKGKVALFNIFEVEHSGIERAKKQAEEKMQADHAPLLDHIKSMGGEFLYFDESHKEEGVFVSVFNTGLKPKGPIMKAEEFIQQFPKESASIEALGYKISSANGGLWNTTVEVRLLKKVSMKESILRSYIREAIMYHSTDPANVESIQQVGLQPGRESAQTLDGAWADEFYGTRPVYLSVRKGKYEGAPFAVDTAKLNLVADLPSLVDTGAYQEEEGMYWDEGSEPTQMIDIVDEDGMVYFDDLLSPGSAAAQAAIEITGTAAVIDGVPPESITLEEIRKYIRFLLKEDAIGFGHDLAASDKFGDQFFGGAVGKEGGREIKRAFANNADHQFLSTLDTVHWTSDIYGFEGMKGRGKDELSATMTAPGDNFDPAAGLPYGIWIKGRITLASNEQDNLYSGFYGDYGPGAEGSEEEVAHRDKSSGRNKRPTISKSYKNYGQLQRGNVYMEKMANNIPYILDQATWDPSKTKSNNEALVDNWKPVGIILYSGDEISVLRRLNHIKTKEEVEEATAGVMKKIMLTSIDLGVPVYDINREVLWSPK